MEQKEMATDREPITMRNFLKCCIFFLMCVVSFCAQAQKGLLGNLVKVATDQYGFIVGSNQKDTLYFITVTSARITKEQNEISVIFSDGKTTNKARFVDQFDVSGKNVALYRYIGNTAKRVDTKYYDDFFSSDQLQYLLMVDGTGGRDADFKIYPYIHKTHRAVFQEMVPGKSEHYYFNKTGGILQQGMVIMNESGKAVVGIVADNEGAKGDRFSVIKITNIAERLERADRGSCRYFNLLKTGESLTPCEKEAIRKEEERLRHIREDIERKNRTRQQRREVRRTSDYWFSFGPAVSGNSYFLKNYAADDGDNSLTVDYGYSLGMNVYFNPNPTAFATMSIRPRYTLTKLKLFDENSVSTSFGLGTRLSMESYEIPIVFESAPKGLYMGIGYVPSYIREMILSYNVPKEKIRREDEIFERPKYLHKLLFEVGTQTKNFRFVLMYQYLFDTFVNQHYEMIIGGEVVKPFDNFKKRYSTWSIEISYRLWSQWRDQPKSI